MSRPLASTAVRLSTHFRALCSKVPSTPPQAAASASSAQVRADAAKRDVSLADAHQPPAADKAFGAPVTNSADCAGSTGDAGNAPPRRPLHPNLVRKNLNSQRALDQFLDIGESAGARRTGRAWRTSELRLKSFSDLHKLWFVLLKERNVLLSEKAWCKTNGRHWTNGASNLSKVKLAMARVKGVVGERLRVVKARHRAQNARLEDDGEGGDEKRKRKRWPEVSAGGLPFRADR